MVTEKKFAAPAVAVIGSVVKLRDKLNWFEHRGLFGQRIVVTRTREQASQLSAQFLELGDSTSPRPPDGGHSGWVVVD